MGTRAPIGWMGFGAGTVSAAVAAGNGRTTGPGIRGYGLNGRHSQGVGASGLNRRGEPMGVSQGSDPSARPSGLGPGRTAMQRGDELGTGPAETRARSRWNGRRPSDHPRTGPTVEDTVAGLAWFSSAEGDATDGLNQDAQDRNGPRPRQRCQGWSQTGRSEQSLANLGSSRWTELCRVPTTALRTVQQSHLKKWLSALQAWATVA